MAWRRLGPFTLKSGGAEEDLQLAAVLAGVFLVRAGKQGFWITPAIVHGQARLYVFTAS